MSKPELFRVQSNCIENSASCRFVILGLGNCLSSQDIVALLELRINHLVGESLSADSNTSQDTIALILVHNKTRFNTTGNFVGVGDNATDKGWLSRIQHLHQVIKLSLVERRDSLATSLLLATTTAIFLDLKRLARMINKAFHKKSIGAILEQFNNGVIEGILVLFKPTGQVVRYSCSIVDDSKVSIGIRLWVGLLEVFTFSKQVFVQLGSKRLISGLWEE